MAFIHRYSECKQQNKVLWHTRADKNDVDTKFIIVEDGPCNYVNNEQVLCNCNADKSNVNCKYQ